MALSALEIRRLAKEYEQHDPQDILRLALECFDEIAISFSRARSVQE